MRIGLISTLAGPVHPDRGGSVEQLVWFLSSQLTSAGHDVTVFGVAGSEPRGRLVPTLPGTYGQHGAPDDWHVCEWINLARAVEASSRFDVLHSHAYLWGMVLQKVSAAPLVHTLHVMPDEDAARLCSMHPHAAITSLSHYQWRAFPSVRPVAVIPHGIDHAAFTFRSTADDYVCFVGRFSEGKGPLIAMETARALGLRLVLAGPRNDYFRREVEPLIDSQSVEYAGWVTGKAREGLLGGARALLYPLQAAEPFGLVMTEAMMCGTPVAAIGIGAVTEIVDEGVTGSCAASRHDFAGAVTRAMALDRREVRRRAELRFSAERMAHDYLAVYDRTIAASQRESNARGAYP